MHQPKPDWLKIKLGTSNTYGETSRLFGQNHIHTICESGRCPNQGECWSRGVATFLIGGTICTRACRFCNTLTGKPQPLDPLEPEKIATVVENMSLKHVVLTSVDRDDLPDLGAQHWKKVISAIQTQTPSVTIEALIPDFQGRFELVDVILGTDIDVVAHNVETVRRLTSSIRSRASYEQSLNVLKYIATRKIVSKSGLMLGLGETIDEVQQCLVDLKEAGCQIVTIGQYLQPSRKQIPVQRYVEPKEFDMLSVFARSIGIPQVVSGPLVRSSYHAEQHIFIKTKKL